MGCVFDLAERVFSFGFGLLVACLGVLMFVICYVLVVTFDLGILAFICSLLCGACVCCVRWAFCTLQFFVYDVVFGVLILVLVFF